MQLLGDDAMKIGKMNAQTLQQAYGSEWKLYYNYYISEDGRVYSIKMQRLIKVNANGTVKLHGKCKSITKLIDELFND